MTAAVFLCVSMQHCPFFYYSMTGKVVQDTNTDFVEFFERKGDCADSCKICLPALFAAVGLSIILDTIIKKFDRRKPFEGTHRTVVCST